MNWTLVVVVVVDRSWKASWDSFFRPFRRWVDALFVVNTGRTTGFPFPQHQQWQTLALGWMLE